MKILRYIALIALPGLASAQTLNLSQGTTDTFTTVINYVISLISILIPILFALAFIVFFWGLSKFILNSDKPEDLKKGKSYMFWGIVVLFILVSVRAIIAFIASDFGIDTVSPLLPEGSTSSGGTVTVGSVTLPDGTPVPSQAN